MFSRSTRHLSSLVLVAVVALNGSVSAFGQDATPARTTELIRQLGSKIDAERNAASKEVVKIGEPALPALRTVAADSGDANTRSIANQLIRTIVLASAKSKSTGLELSLIDSGTFTMGSPKNEFNHRPDEVQHTVRISRPFLIGTYEVTQAEYQQVMQSNPSWFSRTGAGKDKVAGEDTARFPVENVSWYDSVEFCNRLSELDGYPPFYKITDIQRMAHAIQDAKVSISGGNGYRLPTEAEWEYACRASTTSRFHFGFENTGREANVQAFTPGGYASVPIWRAPGRTTKVGTYKPNQWGLYDMHGNASEWVWDFYDKEFYAHSPQDDPTGPTMGTHRVRRGGDWLLGEASARSATRLFNRPEGARYYGGFRVARTP